MSLSIKHTTVAIMYISLSMHQTTTDRNSRGFE